MKLPILVYILFFHVALLGVFVACKNMNRTQHAQIEQAEVQVAEHPTESAETIKLPEHKPVINRNVHFTVDDRLKQIGALVAERLGGELGAGRLPEKVRLIALKQERQLELHVRFAAEEPWQHVKTCHIIAASGHAGPKLKEGDRQVPEGEYGIESLNPNSNYYLALKVAYPSKEDVDMARRDGRRTDNLGSFIMIHGHGGSIGCIAVSNADIEEIFWLAARVGIRNVELLSAPFDFRTRPVTVPAGAPSWMEERYQRLKARMLES